MDKKIDWNSNSQDETHEDDSELGAVSHILEPEGEPFLHILFIKAFKVLNPSLEFHHLQLPVYHEPVESLQI